jgi:prolyl-tRNA synthetase
MEVIETPGTQTIADVAKLLGRHERELVKTLVYKTEQGPVMVLLRGDREANEIKVKNFLGVQELELLPDAEFEAAVGGPVGYCGPVGAKVPRVVADGSLHGRRSWIIGANQPNRHLGNASPGRDFDLAEFADLSLVAAGDPCASCDTPLEVFRGIEVGHIFKLGTKYSEAMNCVYLDEAGERHPMIMGCYGLGIGRTVAAAIEQNYDADGIIWPVPIAPFQVVITAVGRDEAVTRVSEEIYQKLRENGIDVLLDDRDERPGVKFKDADLVGFPVRVAVGAKSLANDQVELSQRRDREKQFVAPGEVVERVIRLVRG